MSWEIAKQLIDDLLYDKYDYINSSNTLGIILDFIGGEPFMEIELIGQIVEYTYNTMIELNHPWLYYSVVSLCSNGVLYTTPKVQSFFKKYGYLCHLSISLDGNKELHDSCRIDLDGKGSYDKVIEAVKLYREQTGGEAPTKMTLSPSNISYLSQAVLNLINENYKEIHLNYAYEPGWTIEHAKILYNELKIITHYIIDNNLYNKIYISLFDEDLGQPMAEDDNANWCGGTTQGGHITIDYCGRIFPCLRYMNSSLNNRQKPICIGEVGKGILLTEEEKENFKKIDNITRRS